MRMAQTCTGLFAVNLFLSAALIVAPWTGVLIGDWSRGARGSGHETLALLSSYLAQVGAMAMVLLLATIAGAAAVLAMGRSRQWRLTQRAAWNVACHASVGWVLMALLPLLFMAAWYTLGTLLKMPVPGSVPGRPVGMAVSWQTVLGAGAPVAGYAIGLAVFVLRLLKGARVCRFATMPRVSDSQSR
jgi:hypothetical protein